MFKKNIESCQVVQNYYNTIQNEDLIGRYPEALTDKFKNSGCSLHLFNVDDSFVVNGLESEQDDWMTVINDEDDLNNFIQQVVKEQTSYDEEL